MWWIVQIVKLLKMPFLKCGCINICKWDLIKPVVAVNALASDVSLPREENQLILSQTDSTKVQNSKIVLT